MNRANFCFCYDLISLLRLTKADPASTNSPTHLFQGFWRAQNFRWATLLKISAKFQLLVRKGRL
ncbi:hypothetical protein DSO57_1027930 [Entomophthora muscae]|uniref:Uncharacterized protein n=1 Tax=Entomophthora muscae TaxID=34485 RepID=A0ACC2SEP7_9FUNG|nr:hypothetical protein DSO57_1027930 [Entomophthora muscae]